MRSPLRSFGRNTGSSSGQSGNYRQKSSSSAKLMIPVVFLAFLALMLQTRWVDKNKEKFVDESVARVYAGVAEATIMPLVCYYCQGRGVINSENKALESLCPICFGVGKNEVKILEEREMICSNCEGMGRHFEGEESVECASCLGRGVRLAEKVKSIGKKQIEYFIVECHICDTRGLLRHPETNVALVCPSCFGIGRHLSRRLDKDEDVCLPCGGMGRIFEEETRTSRVCGRCDSRGVIRMKSKPPADPESPEEPGLETPKTPETEL